MAYTMGTVMHRIRASSPAPARATAADAVGSPSDRAARSSWSVRSENTDGLPDPVDPASRPRCRWMAIQAHAGHLAAGRGHARRTSPLHAESITCLTDSRVAHCHGEAETPFWPHCAYRTWLDHIRRPQWGRCFSCRDAGSASALRPAPRSARSSATPPPSGRRRAGGSSRCRFRRPGRVRRRRRSARRR